MLPCIQCSQNHRDVTSSMHITRPPMLGRVISKRPRRTGDPNGDIPTVSITSASLWHSHHAPTISAWLLMRHYGDVTRSMSSRTHCFRDCNS